MRHIKRKIQVNDILHVYNRGVDRREVFADTSDYRRFIEVLSFCNTYNYPLSLHKQQLKQTSDEVTVKKILLMLDSFYKYDRPLCTIIGFVLMPNHYHIVLKEDQNGGISKFMQKVGISYSKYFNERNDRSGSLFQGKYRFAYVDNEKQLLHLLRYLHANPITANLVPADEVSQYRWSSFRSMITDGPRYMDSEIVNVNFSSTSEYLDFVSSYSKGSEETNSIISNLALE